MANSPDLSKIEKMFSKGKNFELTDSKYKSLTGRPLPKEKSYLANRSAIAKLANENGFTITVIEKKIILKKKKGQ